MAIVIKVTQFLLSLSLLVLVHEFGHFIAARIFKMRVDKFYLFFNPWFSLLKIKGKQTEYGIGWIPFGGYCKIAGMVDESMDTEQLKQPPQPDEFRSRSAWQRLLVMGGGVIMNVVLALAIYIGISYAWGEEYIATKDIKHGYVFSAIGKEMGFRNGDKIVSVDGKPVRTFRDLSLKMLLRRHPVVEVDRDGQLLTVTVGDEGIAKLIGGDAPGEPLLRPRTPFVVDSVIVGGGAAQAGLMRGDSLVAVDGQSMAFADQFQAAFAAAKGQVAQVTLVRDSAGVAVTKTLPVAISTEGMIGVAQAPFDRFIPITSVTYTFWQAFPAGFKRSGTEIANYWRQFELLFRPKVQAYKHIGGPLAIGNMFQSHWNFHDFWGLTALISIALAVFNLLPIPGLDGGHILFTLAEIVTRRKPSDKFLEAAQWVGMLFIFAIIILATGNDIYRIFFKG